MFIKDVLKEELEKSLQMRKRWESALAELPKGSLVGRVIKGHKYYYLVYREDGKVHSDYRGKVSAEDLQRYGMIKRQRAQYRSHLAELKKQIRFIRKALRGKDAA